MIDRVVDEKSLLKGIFLFFLYYIFNITTVNLLTIGKLNDSYLVFLNFIFLLLILFLFRKWVVMERRTRLKFELKNLLASFISIYLFLQSFDLFYRDTNTFIPGKFNFDFSGVSINLPFILLLLSGSLIEELIFRGFMVKRYKNNVITIIGILISSFLYSVTHFGFLFKPFEFLFDKIQFFDFFLLGIILGIIKVRYGLLYAIITHIFYNLLIYLNSQGIVNLFLLDYVSNNYFYICYSITQTVLIAILFLILKPLFQKSNE